ncbi:hypothetical protein O181_027914 [Austropuccinia psidii MF-1]|uniref:Uncharacterized protein n=1 Tax=Austropuccinia psidii MF-1 TaxID=1389203 RepID=A0A9Q3H324_9BASI|nr:hypothetical protein [Austropuccinia psidii MF-1]
MVQEWPYQSGPYGQFGHLHQSWPPGNPLKIGPGGLQLPPGTMDHGIWAMGHKKLIWTQMARNGENEGISNFQEKFHGMARTQIAQNDPKSHLGHMTSIFMRTRLPLNMHME